MFEETYKTLFQKIKVREKHKEIVKENMQKELSKMSSQEKKYKGTPFLFRYIAIASMVLLSTVMLLNWWGDKNGREFVNGGLISESPVETPDQGEKTVRYSHLSFTESMALETPIPLNGISGKLAPFTESLLAESHAVIKGTVIAITFKEYKESGETQPSRQSVVYEIKVDKTYYSKDSFIQGDMITIENDLYTYTSLQSSIEKLSINRQYILALKENEEGLSVLYPFTPQIEVTADGKYFFPDHWGSLINGETKTVIMDTGEVLTYFGEMKLREDPEFEIEYQKIVNMYCQ